MKTPKLALPIWQAIEGVKITIIEGVGYLIGDGASMNIWQDLWVPWIEGFIPKPNVVLTAQNPLVVS